MREIRSPLDGIPSPFAARVSAAAFSPASLFASGEDGAWYDPSDLSTLFQDAAGTTPVASDGDPVRLMLDKSGNSNHAVAPSDAARPLYKTAGGLHWLDFDGVDDELITANNHPFTYTGGVSFYAGFMKEGVTKQFETLFACGTVGSLALNSQKSMGFQVTDNGGNRLATDIWRPSGVRADTVLVTSVPRVASFNILNWSTHRSGGAGIRLDGADEIVTPYNVYDPTGLNVSTMRVGSFDSVLSSSYLNGRVYGMIARNTDSTTSEITNTEAYLAAKSGVTL